ncbi:MAG: hypothetical protein ACJ8FU_08695 [Xanthobacteraceae bacterium]
MVERVARAMWEQRRVYARERGIDLEEWGAGSTPEANGITDEARAAIAAMREPTNEMVDAADEAADYNISQDAHIRASWRAMIDAAQEPQ